MPEKTPKQNIRCTRCGTCCSKGGPSLHRQDLPLLDRGGLGWEALITYRPGETLNDNVSGSLMVLDRDIVKIRPAPGAEACVFYAGPETGCLNYENRPAECRVLDCRDTRAIRKLYTQDRIGRLDILASHPSLAALVLEHEKRVSHKAFARLARQIDSPGAQDAMNALTEMLGFDRHLRALVCERTGLAPEIQDFLFGRPLPQCAGQHGLSVNRRNGRFVLRPAS